MCVGHQYTPANTINVNKTYALHMHSYTQLEVKTNGASCLCNDRNGHHNSERKDT